MASTTDRQDDKEATVTVQEHLTESAMGKDRPMEEVHPQSPGALVWFTYPAILIVALLIALVVVGVWYSS